MLHIVNPSFSDEVQSRSIPSYIYLAINGLNEGDKRSRRGPETVSKKKTMMALADALSRKHEPGSLIVRAEVTLSPNFIRAVESGDIVGTEFPRLVPAGLRAQQQPIRNARPSATKSIAAA
jgi:hypothetical protein